MSHLRHITALLIATICLSLPSYAQTTEPAQQKSDIIFTVVEKQPEFPGGMSALGDYIRKNNVYPEAAKRAGITGNVIVSFVVNADSSIQDVQILKGIGFGCDAQASRLVAGMPNWKPGSQSGSPVRVKYNLPIRFGPDMNK